MELPLEEYGLPRDRAYQVHDLLGDGRYLWSGPRNCVELDPQITPAQIFRIRRQVRTERQFEYYFQSLVERAIIDKNCRVGRHARSVNEQGIDSADETPYSVIRDGIIVIPKDTVLPDGWTP